MSNSKPTKDDNNDDDVIIVDFCWPRRYLVNDGDAEEEDGYEHSNDDGVV